MSKHVPPPQGPKDIEKIDLKEALEERYLAYALSTIMHRALPDVRDGLKPVHRRLLHVMQILRLDPNSAFKKSAKIVGDVMGGYHPHGDQSIYDTLVRMAQEAEDAGFDMIMISDHVLLGPSAGSEGRMENPRVAPLAWYREAWEEQEEILGPDPWEYGLSDKNRNTLDTLVGYSYEQGMLKRRWPLEELRVI